MPGDDFMRLQMMQNMRQGSPSGGGVGAITDQEMARLDNNYLNALIMEQMRNTSQTGGPTGSAPMDEITSPDFYGLQGIRHQNMRGQGRPMTGNEQYMMQRQMGSKHLNQRDQMERMMYLYGIDGRPQPGQPGPRRPMPGIMGGVRG